MLNLVSNWRQREGTSHTAKVVVHVCREPALCLLPSCFCHQGIALS